MNIKLEIQNDKLNAFSPYHSELPGAAKKLGGKWDAQNKCWSFDSRDETRVRDLYKRIYGTDGSVGCADVVTIRAKFADKFSAYRDSIFLGGRTIARATGRDSGAKLGDGVILLSGGFDSGGSAKNWTTVAAAGTVFEIRDLPRSKVDEIKNDSSLAEVTVMVTVIDTTINKTALIEEKEALLARIDDIDKLIADEQLKNKIYDPRDGSNLCPETDENSWECSCSGCAEWRG